MIMMMMERNGKMVVSFIIVCAVVIFGYIAVHHEWVYIGNDEEKYNNAILSILIMDKNA